MVLNKVKIVLICDFDDNFLLSLIYEEINMKKTGHILDWRGVHKISCTHPYIVFTLLNAALDPDFSSMVFLLKSTKKPLPIWRNERLFSSAGKTRASFVEAKPECSVVYSMPNKNAVQFYDNLSCILYPF